MPQAAGSNSQIIYDVETTFGSNPAGPDAKILPFLSDTLGESRSIIQSNVMRSNRNLTKPGRGNRNVTGSINTELNPFMGVLLKHLLGSSTPSAGPPYTHTIKVGALPIGLCIEKGFMDLTTIQYLLYNGCRINRGTFEFGSEGLIPFNIDFLGQKETPGTVSEDSTPTDLGHLPFENFEATIKEGGSPIAIVSKLSLEISNDLDGDSYVIGGAGLRRSLREGKCIVKGTVTALFEDVTLYNKAVGFNESLIEVTLTRGTGLGTAGNESLAIMIPEIVYEINSPKISGPKGVLVELPFSAFYDNATEATSIQMLLKNTQQTL